MAVLARMCRKADFVPVARVTEMLETPRGQFDYDGGSCEYPDIRLVWWAGGTHSITIRI